MTPQTQIQSQSLDSYRPSVGGSQFPEREPVRLAFFTNTRVRAGVEEHILTMLRGLNRAEFHLTLVCPPVLLETMRHDIPEGVDLIPIDLANPAQLRAGFALAGMLRGRKIEILHSHMFQSSLLASPIGWLCRVPVVIETAHGREEWRKGFFTSRFFVDRLVGRLVTAHIAVSAACRDYLVERKKLPAAKVSVIPNGCDLDRFTRITTQPCELRRRLGIGESDPILVVVGRLERQKGHSVLVEALLTIRSEFPNVHLVCVGEGSLLETLRIQAKKLGLTEAIHFVGYQKNTEDWFALADIVVLPSHYEGMPLVAIEALAAGRTMVATAVDGTPDVIINGKTGLTVAPNEPRAMSAAICSLLRDPEICGAMAIAGRKHVMDRFGERLQIQRTREMYLRLLSQRAQNRRGQ